MQPFQILCDPNGLSSFTIPFCSYVDVRVLLPNVAETVNIPAGAQFIVFSSAENFYVRVGGAASVPASDVIDGTGSELNPVARAVKGVDTFSIVAPYHAIVTLSFYA